MAYLVKNDLTTHLYIEIIDEIIRNYIKEFANLAAFPVTGISGFTYVDLATAKKYNWNGTVYVETAGADAIINKMIADGVSEAKAYLNRYDFVKLFGEGDTAPTVNDEFLNGLVKDLICWKLIKISNPNVNLELFESAYKMAKKTLSDVMKGLIDPVWPLKADNPDTPNDDAGNVEWRSQPKRINHY